MDNVGKLYEIYENLSGATNIVEHESEFLQLLEAAKGDKNMKQLAAQFIPKFYKNFPDLAEKALDALIDLAEDEEVSIRKLAVKYLPLICKQTKDFVLKVSDILSQLLQTEDPTEVSIVQTALMDVLNIDITAAVRGILVQISASEDKLIRKRAIEFLNTKIKALCSDIVTKEVEQQILEDCKTIFPKLNGEDFLNLVPVICNLKIARTIPVQNEIVRIIADQIELDSEFVVSADNIAGFLQCCRSALPLFSPFVNSMDYVVFICQRILPKSDEIEEFENGSELVLDILKLLAEMSPFIVKKDSLDECTLTVHTAMLKYIPLPPANEPEDVSKPEEPNLRFTHIECLLFTFVEFLKHNIAFITASENEECLKDLKIRLQFLARGAQHGIKTFRESATDKKSGDEEAKVKAIALRTMNNINALIKDFFRVPPSFKTTVSLSWKPAVGRSTLITAPKREIGSSASSDAKHFKREARGERNLYIPPAGKYSGQVNFPYSRERGRGRGRRFY